MDLSRAISPEDLTPILNNAELRQQLAQFLPDGEELPQTPDEVANTLKSPQFQQVNTNGRSCWHRLSVSVFCKLSMILQVSADYMYRATKR